MRCETCHTEMRERTTTAARPYAYTLAGLPHVGLAGIVVHECPQCAVTAPVIPRIGELHRVIANAFVHKGGPLTGGELRFLRKNAGFRAGAFATLLRIDPAHLSRVENGKEKGLGAVADRLARAVVTAAAHGGEEARKLLLEVAEQRLAAKNSRRATFTIERNRWKAA